HLNRRVFQAAAGLVAFSEWTRRSLIEDYGVDPARVRVLIPTGAAPAYFDVGQRRPQSELHSSGERRPVRLLFVGGDFHRKGGPSRPARPAPFSAPSRRWWEMPSCAAAWGGRDRSWPARSSTPAATAERCSTC